MIFGDFKISSIPNTDEIYGIDTSNQPVPNKIDEIDYITNQISSNYGMTDSIPVTKSLDLGSGRIPRNHFFADEAYGIDIFDFGNPNVKVADLTIDPIPFDDNTFDYITGFDFLEHIPRIMYDGRVRRQPFIDLMSEIWRVLKPNGFAEFHTPAYPHPQAFQDPQHVNIITEETISYFTSTPNKIGWVGLDLGKMYGFKGDFTLINQDWDDNIDYHLNWQLMANKNI